MYLQKTGWGQELSCTKPDCLLRCWVFNHQESELEDRIEQTLKIDNYVWQVHGASGKCHCTPLVQHLTEKRCLDESVELHTWGFVHIVKGLIGLQRKCGHNFDKQSVPRTKWWGKGDKKGLNWVIHNWNCNAYMVFIYFRWLKQAMWGVLFRKTGQTSQGVELHFAEFEFIFFILFH